MYVCAYVCAYMCMCVLMCVHVCVCACVHVCACVSLFLTAWGWGDPHITTLDGRGYTFNGWGEYTLLHSHDNATGLGLIFQGRMVPLNGSNATGYTAFAFQDLKTPVVEVGVALW